jgi:DNA excision repair protein ERCC-4
MLVMNAHTVTDMSGEGFAVRLFRQGNQGGFVRAISDQPHAFAAGFSKVPCKGSFTFFLLI